MLISDQHKFIFVHIPKTGGTSCRSALRRVLSRNDRCHWAVKTTTQHESLLEFKLRVSQNNPKIYAQQFSSYWKFAFVRNPWERVVSLYYFLVQSQVRPEIEGIHDFDQFVEQMHKGCEWILGLHSMRPQADFLLNEREKLMADFVGRYENLHEDFGRICGKLGFAVLLPNKKQSIHKPYHQYYTKKTAGWVTQRFQKDIRRFGYVYE